MSTSRFFGTIEDRLQNLTEFLSFVDRADGSVPRDSVIDWIVSHTTAGEPDAVDSRLSFLEQIDLIESDADEYTCTEVGRWYLRERDPIILYNALRMGVKGFDTIVCAVADEPRSDEELMELLVNEFEECQMETPGVAIRHREWLQILGYLEYSDNRSWLTSSGEAIADQLQGLSAVELDPGKVYDRRELHSKYGGSIQGGIAPSRDEPVVFLFSGGTGEDHGYKDEFCSDGTVVYTGEGQTGDMEMKRGNSAIKDHIDHGRELHLFTMEDKGVRYAGQFMYAGHFFEELPDSDGKLREGIRFTLAPIGEVSFPDSPAGSRVSEVDTDSLDSDLGQFTGPSVYQVPVKIGDDPIRTNFERTVIEGIPRERVEDIYDPGVNHDTIHVWGNQEDTPAMEGDYLLFADRDGRRSGVYTIVARVAQAAILDQDTAKTFTDAVGWGDVTDVNFSHVMFLNPVYEADLDRELFWDTLGFKGWPNDTYSAINFDRGGSKFYEQYDSVEAFVDQIKGQKLYPNPSVDEYESLEETVKDIRQRLSRSGEGRSWLHKRVSEAIIEDWSAALKGFKPSDNVSANTASTLDQIRIVYQSMEPELEVKSSELDIGSLSSFSPSQTLFLGSVRLVQNDLDTDGGWLNQPRLNSILKDSYSIPEQQPGDPTPDIDHPLTDYIAESKPTIYKFTAPPDYWLTTVEYASVSFEQDHRDSWEQLEVGDIILMHSRAEPSSNERSTQQSGLIGVGILGETFEKTKPWWRDEHAGEKSFPMVVSFERWFLTGDIEEIDTTRGLTEKQDAEIEQELGALTAHCLSIEEANEICVNVSEKEFPAQSMFGKFRTNDGKIDYRRPLALIEAMSDNLIEVSPINPHKPFGGTIPDNVLDGLHFRDDHGERILEQISTALKSGKHVLLTGPPGTGKTEIAERVCKHLVGRYPYLYSNFEMTTATADWSTFDTVGGYMPSESVDGGENLSFTPGIVLNRLRNAETGAQSNELMVIDELNRADIDKAFGQLFTLLSGQSVQLPYTINGQEVELTTSEDIEGLPSVNQYVVPNSWRIFATMNAYDKTSLYEMSYAFMRRFAFIRVPAPQLPEEGDGEDPAAEIVTDYAQAWGIDISPREAGAVGRLWRQTNAAVEERSIGPAIIEDVLRYITQHPDEEITHHLTQAVISYIFPQLEGVPKRKQIVREVTAVPDIDSDLIEEAAREMLQVSLVENE